MKNITRKLSLLLALAMLLSLVLTGCGGGKERILIYTSVEDYVIEDMNARLGEAFPDYDITVEYVSTGSHAAKLLTEGRSVTEVCNSTGFSDCSRFIAVFKAKFGKTPLQYQKQRDI